ncbi:GNAT family N-acetyltransferase [Chryseobacterium gambrini]|uniref:GNAT family N-acetyltransferase n=1 Tax=Chryseobacterium gambrini TaxID=373672 RepID=A0AAJ1VJE6_9FLAO|nr:MULTISPECIES: GNAT family N-acetyltransferase [Chryseobacterium]MDN4011746.1 GNAT family N-acetyltransferase [Chryseobacterium gambrini]QWA39069.1 GNAT family N-acetyltransferase [Chryseobacterium sp. ZHDP1]
MKIREAERKDIPQIQIVRNSVKENTLSDPNLVTDQDCEDFLFNRGKGWVCEHNDRILGFGIVDMKEKSIWALFVHPEFENRGIGRKLHNTMLNWYFDQTDEKIWLSTSPDTRAEIFYRKSGWTENGVHGKNEIKFEMAYNDWKNR